MRKRAKFSMTPKILPLTGRKTAVPLLSETYMTRDRSVVGFRPRKNTKMKIYILELLLQKKYVMSSGCMTVLEHGVEDGQES